MITHPAICVNLPVKDLKKSASFFRELGYEVEEAEADGKSARLSVAPNIKVRLMVQDKFKGISPNPVADAAKSTSAVISLRCENKQAVNDLIEKVLAAGGKPAGKAQDYGYMYWWSFQDLDGHAWELLWTPPA